MTDLFITIDASIRVASPIGVPSFVDVCQFQQTKLLLTLVFGDFDITNLAAVGILSGGRLPKQMRVIRKIPAQNVVAILDVDIDDSGRHTVDSAGDFGCIEVGHFDDDSRQEFQKYIDKPKIRNANGTEISSVILEVGEVVSLSFYGGFVGDVLWSGGETFIQYNNNTDNPEMEIEGIAVGSDIISTTGLFGSSGIINVTVNPAT